MIERTRGRTEADVCWSLFSTFGYRSNQTIDACVQFYTKNNMDDIFKDIFHATTVKMALENRRRGEESFVGIFAQANHSHHVSFLETRFKNFHSFQANDLTYFFGLHPIANMTENDKLMNAYYPKVIKQFVKTGIPDPG